MCIELRGIVQCSAILVRSSDVLGSDGSVVDIVTEKLVGRVCRIIGHLDVESQKAIVQAIGSFSHRDVTVWDAIEVPLSSTNGYTADADNISNVRSFHPIW